ncbi:MAG: glycine betaine ABC transporter substrate-binding protein [Corynebacterium sp.]|nr:glycine betaine ABC transporter substrate-binding protein [Corynebacterium sp.]
MNLKKTLSAVIGTVMIGVTLTGCGLRPSTSALPNLEPASLQPIPAAEGQRVVITSKSFTEQLILGKMAVYIADAAGFDVTDMTGVPGSQPSRKLMVSGRAQIAYEYTGTAWLAYLGHEDGRPDKQEQWQVVHDEDAQKNGLTWSDPAPLNNTYAFAVRRDYAEQNNLKTLSDIKNLPVAERTMCVDAEFNSRTDGLNPMLETYDMKRGSADGIPENNISLLDTGTIYKATDTGACNLGEVFTTDGRIQSLDLVVLEDDKHYFPAYNAAPVFNTEFLNKYPEIAERFAQVTQLLDDDTMRSLNLKVDVEGADPSQVALDWMVEQGFITKS